MTKHVARGLFLVLVIDGCGSRKELPQPATSTPTNPTAPMPTPSPTPDTHAAPVFVDSPTNASPAPTATPTPNPNEFPAQPPEVTSIAAPPQMEPMPDEAEKQKLQVAQGPVRQGFTAGQQRVAGSVGSDLFIVIAGNGSCKSRSMSRQFPGLMLNTFFEGFIEAIVDRGVLPPRSDLIFVCYETSSPDMYYYATNEGVPMQLIHEAQLDDMVLKHMQVATRKITMLGYSYGGWRAIKLASTYIMSGVVRAPIVLVTMDPISKVTCQGAFDAGCRRAPEDLSPDERMVLNRNSMWLNVYQKAAIFVGSGAVEGAHRNIEFGGSHQSLPKQRRVWDCITAFLAQTLPL